MVYVFFKETYQGLLDYLKSTPVYIKNKNNFAQMNLCQSKQKTYPEPWNRMRKPSMISNIFEICVDMEMTYQ
jgi:hypothetical protein